MATGLLFSGQGAQMVGMAKSLYEGTEEGRRLFDQANEILGFDLKTACFEGPEARLIETSYCQPALYVHGFTVFSILRNQGELDDLQAVLGLSLGELTAYAAAGVYDFETGLRIVAERGRLMQEACEQTQGAMASIIGGTLEDVEKLCADADIDVANVNCPGQIVISGEKEKVAKAIEAGQEMGFKRIIPLNVAGAYHSRLMEPARAAFEAFLKPFTFFKPEVSVFTNTTGQKIEDPKSMKTALVKQVVSPVLFEDCLRAAQGLGVLHFYECGPGNTLAGLARRTDKAITVQSISEMTDLKTNA